MEFHIAWDIDVDVDEAEFALAIFFEDGDNHIDTAFVHSDTAAKWVFS